MVGGWDEEKRASCGRRMRGREKRAGVRGCDLGGAETLAWTGRNGGAPRQFVRKTDVFPTQCLLKSGFVSRISSPPFRPVRVRFRSHPNQCPAPRHVSPFPASAAHTTPAFPLRVGTDGRRAQGGRCPEKKEKSDKIIKIQNCMYFSKNKKIRKKVLTFALGGVIITKLSARATVNEFF